MDYIRGCADRIRSLPSAQPDITLESAIGFLHDIGWMQKHDEEMTTSAYTEGYIAAESKYRKMWDEMQANIKEKAFGKRKGLVHTADIDAMPTIEPERKKMSNKEWVDFLSEQFTVSHTSAREMLHDVVPFQSGVQRTILINNMMDQLKDQLLRMVGRE